MFPGVWSVSNDDFNACIESSTNCCFNPGNVNVSVDGSKITINGRATGDYCAKDE